MESLTIKQQTQFVSARIKKFDSIIDKSQKSYYADAVNAAKVARKIKFFQDLRKQYTQFLIRVSQNIIAESQLHSFD